MFSIFEALLQDRLKCSHGFNEAADVLKSQGATDLESHFDMLRLAINVLKHGEGRSYEELLKKNSLPFRVKQPDESFFDEGDVSEISTLVEVDDAFVIMCAETIREVAAAVRKERPEFIA